MLTTFIAILALAIGVYIGSIVFGKEPEKTAEPKPDTHSPMVVSMVFRQPLKKSFLVEDVLHPQCYKFMAHFDIKNRLEIRVSKKYEETLNQIADAIMQWYNPEYNELLLIAHQEPNDHYGFVVDWTWKKPSNG